MADAADHTPRSEAVALRDAADAVEDECTHSTDACFCGSASWLRDRADRIDRKEATDAE